MKILVINAGSSSLKYQLMNPDTGDVFAKGLCERISIDGRLTHSLLLEIFTTSGVGTQIVRPDSVM